MAKPPVDHTAEVEIRQMLFGQLIENTLYFLITGEWDDASLLALATSASHWFVASILPQLSSELTLREVVARDLSAGSVGQQVFAGDSGSAGAAADAAAPSNVAVAISFRSARGGRSFRGRNYIAGLSLLNVTENQVFVDVGVALTAAYNGLAAAISADVPTAQWVIVSYFADGAMRVTPEATPVTVATLTDFFIDSQRKRLTGRGS